MADHASELAHALASAPEFTMTLRNREIFEFYQRHPSLDFESMNIILTQLLQQIFTSASGSESTVNETISSLLLAKIKDVEASVHTIQDATLKTHSDLSLMVAAKTAEAIKDYNSELKVLLQVVGTQQQQYLEPLLQKYNQELLRTTLDQFSSVVLGNGEGASSSPESPRVWLEAVLSKFKETMLSETSRLVSCSSLGDVQAIENFKTTLASRLSENQTATMTLINASERRLEQKLTETERRMAELRELTSTNVTAQSTLHGHVQDILRKFENSSGKGNVSEMVVHNLLLGMYPSADIQHVGNEQKETGDILFSRANKPRILIENKDHESRNVGKQDVEKFIRDCDLQECCGIMMAQHRGIANKENFEIQFHNGQVLLFMHKVRFDPETIKIGIDIVETLKLKMDELQSQHATFTVSKDVMDAINREFAAFAQQKHSLMRLLRDSADKLMSAAQELAMPSLEKYLHSNYAFAGAKSENMCQYCEKFVPKSMAHHLRYCDKNPNRGGAGVGAVMLSGEEGAEEGAEVGGGGGVGGGSVAVALTVGGGEAAKKHSSSASSVKGKGKTRIK